VERLGAVNRTVDRSALVRHYMDFSPEKLKEIYDKANLKVLS
jgi:hypothetical protein